MIIPLRIIKIYIKYVDVHIFIFLGRLSNSYKIVGKYIEPLLISHLCPKWLNLDTYYYFANEFIFVQFISKGTAVFMSDYNKYIFVVLWLQESHKSVLFSYIIALLAIWQNPINICCSDFTPALWKKTISYSSNRIICIWILLR